MRLRKAQEGLQSEQPVLRRRLFFPPPPEQTRPPPSGPSFFFKPPAFFFSPIRTCRGNSRHDHHGMGPSFPRKAPSDMRIFYSAPKISLGLLNLIPFLFLSADLDFFML